MYKVYEVDYHERTWLVGTAETMKEARSMARKAVKASGGEFPAFIDLDGETVCVIR